MTTPTTQTSPTSVEGGVRTGGGVDVLSRGDSALPTGPRDACAPVEVRASRCGSLRFESGATVWFDELAGKQFSISGPALQVISQFQDWTALDVNESTVRVTGTEDVLGISAEGLFHLLNLNLLVERGGARAGREQVVLDVWSGASQARTFHFATRTSARQRFASIPTVDARGEQKHDSDPAPAMTPQLTGDAGDALDLTVPSTILSRSTAGDVVDRLYRRRSCRHFSAEAVTLGLLADLLLTGAGATFVQRAGEYDDYYLRTSASGGARHPVNVYCVARRVDGLDVATWAFDPVHGSLLRVAGPLVDEELMAATADQWFFAQAAVVFVFTASPEREFWKYPFARAYRVVMADFGHLSQSLYLTANHLGLGATVTCATRDEVWEQHLHLTGDAEFVVGAMAIGIPSSTSDDIPRALGPGGPA